MKKGTIFIIIFLVCVNVVVAEQIRVIDKITVSKVTEDRFHQIRPSVYGNKVVWMDYRNSNGDENSDIYLKDLITNEEIQITNTPEAENFPIIRGHYIFFIRDNKNYLYDLKTNTEKETNLEEWDSISDEYPSSYTKYPYFYGRGISEVSHRINRYDDLSEFNFQTQCGIWDNKIFFEKALKGYLFDIITKSILSTHKLEFGCGGVSGFFNNILVGATEYIYFYDLNSRKSYTIKGNKEPDESLGFDGEKIVWSNRISDKENAEKYPLYKLYKGFVNSDIYIAKIKFKFIEKEKLQEIKPTIEEVKIPSVEETSFGHVTPVIQGCIKDSHCEPKLCNIETGDCVECYNGKCNCKEGYKECMNNTKCVKLKSKKAGDYYDCEFECESGLGKNNQCIDPITIKLSTAKKIVKVGENTDITISLDNALDTNIEANLLISLGNGLSISQIQNSQSCSQNICKLFDKVGAKQLKQVSIGVECVEEIKNTPIKGKITYTAEGLSTTIEETIELNCINNLSKKGFFSRLFDVLMGIFS